MSIERRLHTDIQICLRKGGIAIQSPHPSSINHIAVTLHFPPESTVHIKV